MVLFLCKFKILLFLYTVVQHIDNEKIFMLSRSVLLSDLR